MTGKALKIRKMLPHFNGKKEIKNILFLIGLGYSYYFFLLFLFYFIYIFLIDKKPGQFCSGKKIQWVA